MTAKYQYPFSEATEEIKRAVWDKGITIPNFDPSVWRQNAYGTAIKYWNHGDTSSEYGWEIDHIKAKANGGSDDLENLQPLQWENNRKKGDS